jgi:hypothetical protein
MQTVYTRINANLSLTGEQKEALIAEVKTTINNSGLSARTMLVLLKAAVDDLDQI